MGVEVYGSGRKPNRAMFVGEAPGAVEAKHRQPFVGQSGQELARYLLAHDLVLRHYYRTNIVKEYTPGNPDPTATQIRDWTPVMVEEVRDVKPQFIIAVGRYATRWFLGEDADMEVVHGMPHEAGAFDASREDRAAGAIVIPVYHPAFGFYDNDARALITADFAAVAALMSTRKPICIVSDQYEGEEDYRDVTGEEMADLIQGVDEVGLDTEGYPNDTWSIQISTEPGNGLVLRCEQPDFDVGIAALQEWADAGGEFDIHNAMYDVEMCRVMGLDLFDATIFDSMVAAYLMRLEPQGLKALAYRWTGMRMSSYAETVGKPGIDKQVNYLLEVANRDNLPLPISHLTWPKPEERLIRSNDGTCRLYTPQPIKRRAEAIVEDYYSEKLDKDGNRVDPMARWKKADEVQRKMVEDAMGPMPRGTLADIELPKAVWYSARDADAAIRTRPVLEDALKRGGLIDLFWTCMQVQPIFEEMQSNGMPASRVYFADLAEEMQDEMDRLQSRISHRYFGNRPFNPASPKQVATLMRRRGLVGAHRTKTGAMSTGQKSVAHLRHTDAAMGDIIDWREHQKIKDSFCSQVLERIPDGTDLAPVRGQIKTTRVATRRISMSDPNLTAIPIRHELGRRVRDGYRCPPGERFGAWDLSQVEMRYMAHLSQDKFLMMLIKEGRDIHAETAARIFNINLDDVHPMKHRYPAKRAGFGIITNIGGSGLYDQLRMYGCEGWSVKKCDKLIEKWLGVYEGVATFLDDCKDEVRQTGVVRDRWGMPRFLPGVYSSDRKLRAESERAASSHKIQGGAQGMIQHSMAYLKPQIRALQEAGENVRWLLQIHDEVVLRFDKELWGVLNALVIDALTNHHGVDDISVPIDAEGAMSQTWGGLK